MAKKNLMTLKFDFQPLPMNLSR